MAQSFSNFIAGQWVPARSGATFTNSNPATGADLGAHPDSGSTDVDAAVAAARAAFESWRLTPAPKRAELMFRLGALIATQKERLARAATSEMGKILIETRGDVQEGVDMAYLAAGEGRRMYGVTTPSEMPNKFAMSMRVPIGVVGVITAWNFPFAVPTWKIFPALVAGNTVVFKPSEETPEMGYHLAKLIEEAGYPAGVFNLVQGSGKNVGWPITQHPGVDVLSFTGSNGVGTLIATEGARLGKRVSLEMGGKNAVIVMDDADVALAANAIAWGAFGTTGQRCTATSRVIVHERVHDELAKRVVERARAIKLGDGLDESVEMGPVINARQLEKISGYMPVAAQEGVEVLVGGGVTTEGALARGHFFKPTVFTNVKPQMRVAQEEIFGPVVGFLKVKSLEEAVAVNNAIPYGLSSSIFTLDVNRAFAAMRDLSSGIVYVNHGTTGAETHLPFGGVRGTGNGHREAGHTMLDAFTEWKSVYVDFSGRLQRAQIDNS
ncbi:MAG: aldehyde dehydrogenase family protein [Candidatus Eisenbacteria bacterium]|uniref:Aldehyde dehydrogenase family protein n=1 Tax=Eiseniibacteriota bacterium TaxID=2212470 RepID=A0A849SFN9_UNCEI|nr:aldehyde dehydrogenase family protein [Candidatus Eisenbacteria bacterium]